MRNLVVLGFDGLSTADHALGKLIRLQGQRMVNLEDACVVRRASDGDFQVCQAVNLTTRDRARDENQSSLWGRLARMPFLKPVVELMVGAINGTGANALSSASADRSFRDSIIGRLGNSIPKGSSALLVVFSSPTDEMVLNEIRVYQPRAYGRIRSTD